MSVSLWLSILGTFVNLQFGEKHRSQCIFRGIGLARGGEPFQNLGLPVPAVAVSAQALVVGHGTQETPAEFLTHTWPSESGLIHGVSHCAWR